MSATVSQADAGCTTWMEYQALLVSFPKQHFSSHVEQWLHQQWSTDPLLEQAIPWARCIPRLFPTSRRLQQGFQDTGNASCIGLFQFTPCGQYIACVTETDTIAVVDLQQNQSLVHSLRSHLQYNIRSIAFRPTCPWQLAVGCGTGIAWWKKNQLQWLTWKQHKQVEYVSWSRDGSLLASFSRFDACLLIWDVGLSQALVLLRETTLGICDISFGVCRDSFLFVGYACSKYHFTVLDTLEWKPQRWKKQQQQTSRCKVAWSEHSVAIVASGSRIYALDIYEQQLLWTECIPNFADNAQLVDIVWDPSAQRLAVMWIIPDQDNLTQVALYSTECEPIFRMNLIGWITGPETESNHALHMSFQPSRCCSFGALLGKC